MTSSTCGLITLKNANHFNELQEVWRRWLALKVKGTSNIRQQREGAMRADSGSFFGMFNYYRCIPKEHVPSAMKYMEDGEFRRTPKRSFVENPTLTGPPILSEDAPFTYCVPTSVLPFVGWDYIEVEKFKYNKSLVVMYGEYIENKLARFMEKLSSKQVSFSIILGDCLKIEKFFHKREKYDRILSSNLMDYILLPELLRWGIQNCDYIPCNLNCSYILYTLYFRAFASLVHYDEKHARRNLIEKKTDTLLEKSEKV